MADAALKIEIENLHKSFGPKVVLDGLSLDLRAGESLVVIGGSGTGDIYKVFAIAERDGEDIRVTSIPEDFEFKSDGMFDPKYMTALYDLGYSQGAAGVDWLSYPPDFAPLK